MRAMRQMLEFRAHLALMSARSVGANVQSLRRHIARFRHVSIASETPRGPPVGYVCELRHERAHVLRQSVPPQGPCDLVLQLRRQRALDFVVSGSEAKRVRSQRLRETKTTRWINEMFPVWSNWARQESVSQALSISASINARPRPWPLPPLIPRRRWL